ncbi:hypothetical protein [Mycolicibacterium porcinum]|uniref:TIR domain-containing protein n=1 Tax=Mycolicibacterium porcinum TaxID=39693 RepID=A0ABV3VAZ2_9MYCO
MKIFISWSGHAAHEMADFLEVWLVKVIQALQPFVSSSIESGSRWDAAIASALEETSEGIVVVTSRNQNEPWLNFEAGALAKATDASRVRPLLIDLTPTDFNGPISSFQATSAADKAGVFKMLKEINDRCDRKLADAILQQTFEREWPDFETKLGEVIELEKASGDERPPGRGTPEVVAEILERVRVIERETAEQRFQIGSLASEMMEDARYGRFRYVSDPEQEALIAQRLRDQDREREERDQRAQEIARQFEGRTVEASASNGERIRGEVVGGLARGLGMYVRVAVEGSRKTLIVPVETVTEIEDRI